MDFGLDFAEIFVIFGKLPAVYTPGGQIWPLPHEARSQLLTINY
jgi:hypothetical protein